MQPFPLPMQNVFKSIYTWHTGTPTYKMGGGEGGEIVLFCLVFKGIIFFIMAFPEFKKLYLGEGEKFITSENVQSLYR